MHNLPSTPVPNLKQLQNKSLYVIWICQSHVRTLTFFRKFLFCCFASFALNLTKSIKTNFQVTLFILIRDNIYKIKYYYYHLASFSITRRVSSSQLENQCTETPLFAAFDTRYTSCEVCWERVQLTSNTIENWQMEFWP